MNALTASIAPAREALRAALGPWRQRWAQASSREQTLVRLASVLILLTLVWLVGVAPALRTLRTAQSQGPQLRAQLQTMLLLQDRAKALQAQATTQRPQDTEALLEAALPTLGGSARMVLAGDRATMRLEGSGPDALAQWLAQVRLNAGALPVEVQLRQNQGLWSGTVVLQLPTRAAP